MRLPITKENVYNRIRPILSDYSSVLWSLLNKIDERDPFIRGELQENYFAKANLGYISLKNTCINDPEHLWDLRLGDFYDTQLGVNVDLKIGTKYTGAISDNSINNFSGWYLCLNPKGTKAYFMNSTYLVKLIAEGRLKKSYIEHAYGEVDYKDIIDNENAFCITIKDISLF